MNRNCDRCIHHVGGACSKWKCQMETISEFENRVRNEEKKKTVETFLALIDDAIIARKAHSLKPTSSILDHVNDFDEVKREKLHEIANKILGGDS